jgi:hypothetical protein
MLIFFSGTDESLSTNERKKSGIEQPSTISDSAILGEKFI